MLYIPLLILFGIINIIAIIIIFILLSKHKKSKKQVKRISTYLATTLYELQNVKTLTNEDPYQLTLQKITENIISSIQTFLPFSTISYLLLEEKGLVVSTFINESVSPPYVESVNKILFTAVCAVDPRFGQLETKSLIYGQLSNTSTVTSPKSYFNVPLIFREQLMGFMTITSLTKNAYEETQMKVFYNLLNQAVLEVERVNNIIATEQEKLNAMLMSIPSGAIVFMVGKNGFKLSTINASARDFLQLEASPGIKRVFSGFEPTVKLEEELNHVLEEKKNVVLDNIKIFDRVFKVFVTPVFLYGTGKVIGVTVTMQDITLERQIQEIRDTFTNMVVHELRAPLTSIKGASGLILSGKLSDVDRDKMLGLIKTSTESMLAEINELLDAAKIEAGRFVLNKENADLGEVVKQKVEVFMPVAQQKEITLTLDQQPMPQFEFDRERVGQILNNLLSNSVKFTHQKGTIHVMLSREGDFARVMVSDNGIGIPTTKQGTLFAKYIQANQGGNKSAGTGLGLYISKNIIESHGGKIWFESQEGKGTAFYFTLPIQNEEGQIKAPINPVLEATGIMN